MTGMSLSWGEGSRTTRGTRTVSTPSLTRAVMPVDAAGEWSWGEGQVWNQYKATNAAKSSLDMQPGRVGSHPQQAQASIPTVRRGPAMECDATPYYR